MKPFISTTLKGMIIGIANIIPGVSGGTMAFVLGIYKQLTEAIGYFLIRPEKRKEYFLFLANLGIGVVLGFLIFAKLISYLLGIDLPVGSPVPLSYVPTFGFFLGLIIGSIPVLFKLQTDTKISSIRIILTLLGFGLLFALASLREPSNNITTQASIIKDFGIFKLVSIPLERGIWLFIVGILTAFTMVVPGVSGSALLVSLGEYGPILNYISDRSLIPITIIGGGVSIGIILATLLMAKMLEQRAGATFYFIMGLIIASCIQIMIQMLSVSTSIVAWIICIPSLACGIYLAYLSAKLQPKENNNYL